MGVLNLDPFLIDIYREMKPKEIDHLGDTYFEKHPHSALTM